MMINIFMMMMTGQAASDDAVCHWELAGWHDHDNHQRTSIASLQ